MSSVLTLALALAVAQATPSNASDHCRIEAVW